MKTAITDMLGVDFPLLAFSHCRDVVAAVTNAGGFGVLGAAAFTPDELDVELGWIDNHVGGRPYGVDVLVPATLADTSAAGDPSAALPPEHLAFVNDLLRRYGVLGAGEQIEPGRDQPGRLTHEAAEALLDVAFAHSIRLVGNALGPPTPGIMERARRHGVPVAALVGSVKHALRQVEAGVDILVAQGTEAGGHTGEISTMVLVPDVVDAAGSLPVLAAGGIASGRQVAAALALGAAGVWTGSVWLTTEESETHQVVKHKMLAATSTDTIRSKARTGKPSRQLRTVWHDEWEGPDSPGALPMPLMGMISEPAMRRIEAAAEAHGEGAERLATYFVGQVVGRLTAIKPARQVVYEIVEEFTATMDRLDDWVAE